MNEITAKDIFFITGGFAFLIWAIATFLFGRISVQHIEREMAKEGIEPPVWDKGIGARMVAYAGVIVFPNLKRHASLVNIEATKRLARNKDKKLALFYTISMLCSFIMMFTIAYLYAPNT
jgi:hypothetical protein